MKIKIDEKSKKSLATAIIKTAAFRENSWDEKAVKYEKDIRESAEIICEPDFSEIVFVLLFVAWNDALDWAGNILGEVETKKLWGNIK